MFVLQALYPWSHPLSFLLFLVIICEDFRRERGQQPTDPSNPPDTLSNSGCLSSLILLGAGPQLLFPIPTSRGSVTCQLLCLDSQRAWQQLHLKHGKMEIRIVFQKGNTCSDEWEENLP